MSERRFLYAKTVGSFLGATVTSIISRELVHDITRKEKFFPNIPGIIKPAILLGVIALHIEETNKVLNNIDSLILERKVIKGYD